MVYRYFEHFHNLIKRFCGSKVEIFGVGLIIDNMPIGYYGREAIDSVGLGRADVDIFAVN